MAGKPAKKSTQHASDQFHHSWCRFVAMPRDGCEHCEQLYADYPFNPGETSAEATARYFPVIAVAAPEQTTPPAPDLVMVKPGRPVLQATPAMSEPHERVQEALDEIEILLRENTVTVRRNRKAEEIERVEEARTTHLTATRRRTRLVVLETDGHKRLARQVKTTANKLEKDGRLPRDLAKHLYAFAKRVADGMGAATEDEHDSSNRTTAGYQPVATLSGYGSRTMADRHLTGMAAHQEMRHRIPSELMPIYDQIVDEEVTGQHPLGRTLHELGEALGYKHKQTTAAGGALVYAVVCLIAHYMRGRGIPRGELRQTVTSPRLLQESA